MKGINVVWVVVMLFTGSCISDYSFDEVSNDRALVVEGFVSDIAYNAFDTIEANPRYFEVKLSWSSRVKNIRNELVTGAEVEIIDELNEHWDYVEEEDGIYRLYYEEFSAQDNRGYKIKITLSDGKIYESNMQEMVAYNPKGEFSFEEAEIETYEIYLGEEIIGMNQGLKLTLDMQANQPDDLYMKWDFDLTYIYIAYLSQTNTSINYKCWVEDELYYNHFLVSRIPEYGSSNELLFLDLDDIKIHDGFAILVKQYAGNQDYFNYWDGIKKQEDQSDLFASPPYNLKSNLYSVDHNSTVYGYFGVVRETFYRWYFTNEILSYHLKHPTVDDYCGDPELGEPAPLSCFDCTQLSLLYGQTVTNIEPTWWNDDSF